ncbi:MAG: InlB B-repeat-containing protein [Acholeplasmataceae bacterium]
MKNKFLYLLLFVFSLLLVGCIQNKEDFFTVSFETYGGQYIASQKVKDGEYAVRPNDPIKKGYDFKGWFSDNNFNNEFIFETVKITSNMTVYAKFIETDTIETYNIKFMDSDNLIHEVTYQSGEMVTKPSDPTKEGYTFIGWFLNNELFRFDQPVNENMILVAKFEIIVDPVIKHSVTYNNEDNTLIEKTIYNQGSMITQPKNPEKEGYEFIGWFLNNELFTFNTPISSDLVLVAKFKKVATTYQITLDTNGGTVENTLIIVNENETITLPIPTHPDGLDFVGWFDANNNPFTSDVVTQNLTLYAKYKSVVISNNYNLEHGTYPEAIWIELEGTYTSVSVKYKVTNTTNYQALDQELIRKDNGVTLIDILGLKSGDYDVDILINDSDVVKIKNILVKPHDRSGYAHFKYTAGIGAYKNDGTLKDDAIVIYVTEENKNSITIPGINQTGLGWILNNAQYSRSSSNTYNMTEYNSSLAKFNRPILFRVIGKVTAPEGVTAHNSTINGGSPGDNGNMVRIKDANHITIEGVGQGAEIYGWGIHFMASSFNRGIGFEVRNITFDQYPEDALGLEGVQSSGVLTLPVQRGWVHNSTFKQGYCADPAESDKAFGDGSLDIKRGEYFTISYNKFEDARKTNLIGGSDDNLTYHLTYHHNLWLNASSRTPLARQGNIHMYNNVFMIADDNQGEPSTAMDARANAFIFSEANFFHAIKNPFGVRTGAIIKSYGDVLYSTYGNHHQTEVESRDQTVDDNNKYKNFDTNQNVFYYDDVNKKSNVSHLTDAITAKKEVITSSGTYKKNNKIIDVNFYITKQTPIQITETIENTGGKILKGTPFYVFKLDSNALFEMVAGTTTYKPKLVTIYGEEMLTGTGSVNLTPGIYVLESEISHGSSKGVSQAKESHVNSFTITLETEEIRQQRINHYNEALNNIPAELVYSNEHLNLIDAAESAYHQLTEDEKPLVNYAKLQTITNNMTNLGKAHIEALISDIGVVGETSYTKINLARTAYDEARLEIRNVVSNYQVLVDAENAYKEFETTSLVSSINDTATFNTIIRSNKTEVINLKNIYLSLESRYEALSQEAQVNITNYSKVENNLNELNKMLTAHEIKELVNEVIEVRDYFNEIEQAYNDYQNLSSENKAILTTDDINKLNNFYQEIIEIKSQRVEQLYYYESNNPYFEVIKTDGKQPASFPIKPAETHYDQELSLGLKLEAATEVRFTASSNFRIVMEFLEGESIKINGEIVNIVDNKIELDYTAGTYLITRNTGTQPRMKYLLVIENY